MSQNALLNRSAQNVSSLLPHDTAPTYTTKERALKQLHLLLYQSGLSSLYAHLKVHIKHESVASILMYHSIPSAAEIEWIDPCNSLSAEAFETQIRFLAEHRHVISLNQLVEQIENGEPIRRGSVAITFDDGYRNNLTVAAPILAKYNMPATIYLATAYVDKGESQWIDILYSAFRARSQHQLNLESFSIESLGKWDLTDDRQRQQAYRAIAGYLIEANVECRQALLQEIDRQLTPKAYPPRLALSWDEVRVLKDKYPDITLGIHTANHLDLRTHSDQTTKEMEIAIEQMMRETGDRPEHLAFPYNRYSEQAQAQVIAAQLRSAVVATDDPIVRGDTFLYALPRLDAPKSMLLLKSWTNGGFPDISNRLLGRKWIHPF